MALEPILAIKDFSLEFATYRGAVQALSGVSVEVAPGEIVALVGESGSGKSVAAMASIRLLPPKLCKIVGGSIALVGRDLLAESARSISDIRGKQVSMVFQEPMSALNPTLRIGRQISQVLRRHERLEQAAAMQRALQLLSEMQVSDPARVLRSYPFELSGGMRQRVLIAMAFACNPQLLIADEPTTALDVTVQAQVLSLIRERALARGTAVLFITHDLAVVSQLCTRIYVMYAGQIVERGLTQAVLRRPLHPYTRALLRSLPESGVPGAPLRSIPGTVPSLLHPPDGCRFRARCDMSRDICADVPPFSSGSDLSAHGAACWFAGTLPSDTAAVAPSAAAAASASASAAAAAAPAPAPASSSAASASVSAGTVDADAPILAQKSAADARALVEMQGIAVRFPVGRAWRGRAALTVHALNGIDLELRRGETLAIVGESGCGKSTLAQLVMSLLEPSEGQVRFDGTDLRSLTPQRLRETRQRLQMVFQDPQASLDPRMPAWRIIAEPLQVARRLSTKALRQRAGELAQLVGIRDEQLERYPHEFSGGQRQRLAIARALALEPELLVLDEPTSALDVSIQAQILNLLMELQSRLALTYLFISHNVAVVRHIANRVAVIYLGQIVELGPTALVLDHPAHPYTRQLIGAVPRLHQALAVPARLVGEAPSNLSLPAGCYFGTRCGQSNEGCGAAQVLRTHADGRDVRCHRA
jgi:peptide/nickel transport system ATP-binding protein